MSVVSCQMLVTSSTLNTKTGEVENKILIMTFIKILENLIS